MSVTEQDLRACEEVASPLVIRVLESGLTVRKCDKTTTQLNFLELSSIDSPKEGVVDDSSIAPWFEEASDEKSTPRLRLLYATEDEGANLPFTRTAWSTISTHLDLSLDHFKMIRREDRSRLTSFWKDRRDVGDTCDAHFLKIQGAVASWTFISFLLVIHHRPSTDTTHGLILIRGSSPTFEASFIASLKSSFARLGAHPLYTATMLWKAVVVEHSGDSLRIWKDVASMNQRLNGFVPENYYTTGEGRKEPSHDPFQWATERVDSLDRMPDGEKRRKIDYLRETKVAQSLALEQSFFLEILVKQGMMMRRVLREVDNEARIAADNKKKGSIEDIRAALNDVEMDNEAQIGHVKRNQTDISTMSQMLFHFMALEEGRLSTELAASSKEIAEASMRDASAMKSISVLTMIFLPATAVASIFSTPFFDWNGADSNMDVRGFQLFWIVSIPLTVVVLLTWILVINVNWSAWWMKLQARRQATQQERNDLKGRNLIARQGEQVGSRV